MCFRTLGLFNSYLRSMAEASRPREQGAENTKEKSRQCFTFGNLFDIW